MALIPLNTFKTKTATLTTSSYDKSNCARDTGLILDSIAFDLLFGGTTQSTYSGLQYWAQGATKIPGETLQTLSAIDYAKEISRKIAVNEEILTVYQTGVTQSIDLLNPGSTAGQERITEEFDRISNIIEYGTSGSTSTIEPNGNIISDTGLLNTAALLQSNKEFIQAEVSAFVLTTFVDNAFTYDKAKSKRDTKLIVDSIAFDLLFQGSSQSNFAGLQYWVNEDSVIPPTENEPTLLSIAYAKSIATKVVVNETVNTTINNTTNQYINELAKGDAVSQGIISDRFDNIYDIIDLGTATVTDDVISNGFASTDTFIENSYSLLQGNKSFIQDEVVAWINNNVETADPLSIWHNFVYDSTLCRRDVGFIVDCVSFDLLYGGNRQSIQAGVYYYSFSNTASQLPTVRSECVTGINYMKSLLSDIILGNQIPVTYQISVPQVTDLDYGTAIQVQYVQDKIDIITNIIENGPAIVTSKTPISLYQSSDTSDYNAFAMLLANKEFLAAELSAYIDNVTTSPFDFDVEKQTFCHRDVGFIVDCVTFDIRHTGNRQATQAGVYYYDHSATVSIVPFEKQATIDAFNHVRNLLSNVVKAIKVTPLTNPALLQSEVLQITNLPGIVVSNTTLLQHISDKVTVINSIIDQGPSSIRGSVNTFGTIIGGSGYTDGTYNSITLELLSGPAPSEYPVVNIVIYGGAVTEVVLVSGGKDIQLTTGFTSTSASLGVGTGFKMPVSKISPYPISLTASTDSDTIKAYNLILANKPFITAEIIKMMDTQITKLTKIYTTPPGVTSIVLMAQAANVSDEDIAVTFSHYRNLPVLSDPSTLNGYQAGDTTTEIVKGFVIPPNDSVTLINGKMIVESFDSIVAFASKAGSLKVTLSILETANA